ncbi:MAG: nucleotidyltransferase family protein [Pseudomonadota bacterium]
MDNFTAVLLAAGLSRRMGEENKLLMPVDGDPMVRKTVTAYVSVIGRVVVVTGHQAPEVRAVLEGLDVEFVHNAEFASGQASSVATGLRSALGAEHVLVGLGDQPMLAAKDINALVAAHLATGGSKISVPHNGKSRGNPIAIPGALVGKMLEDEQNPGCGKFTRERPDLVSLIHLPGGAYFQDVDTTADYAALAIRRPATEGVS